METEYNPNDFQGRSEDKMKRNYIVFTISLIAAWVGMITFLIYNLFEILF